MTQKEHATIAQSSPNIHRAAGPLVVSAANPRYFTIQSGGTGGSETDRKAIYLTGSHIWNNFQDGMGPGPDCASQAEQFDFEEYLAFLQEHGHNFIRLWRWEQFKSQAAGGGFHLCMTPQPWQRTGPGNATDGRPKFNLASFDASYFARLRERVMAAGSRGIYVAVMLFDGWALHLSPPPDNVAGHPFYSANNVNGIGITSIVDYQVLPLEARIQALQEAYIRKVVDTVQDLPNVLYEVANESSGGGTVDRAMANALGLPTETDWGDSTDWQYWVIHTVKQYEQQRGYDRHPIGMTMQFPVASQIRVNDPLFNSPADWISPGFDDAIFAGGGFPMAPGSPPSHWYDDPPASDGRKVVITDTDHYAPGQGDALWVWKSFLRGHHPILMDYGIIAGVHPTEPAPGIPPYASFEPARFAMGDTLQFAQRMDLIAMQPREDLCSTGYILANPGEEYLILQPKQPADPFTVMLDAGAYTVEWYDIDAHNSTRAGTVQNETARSITFTQPFSVDGPAVLYLKRQ